MARPVYVTGMFLFLFMRARGAAASDRRVKARLHEGSKRRESRQMDFYKRPSSQTAVPSSRRKPILSVTSQCATLPWPALRQRHPEVFAYLPRQVVIHLAVAGDCAAFVQGRVMPPRVAAAFAKKCTAMRRKMSQEIATLHTAMLSSS
jgi:hypothetical protein